MRQPKAVKFRSSPRAYGSATIAGVKQVAAGNLALIAAGVAFFSMLSIFPGLAALIALLSLISDPEVVVQQIEVLRDLIPADVYDILNTQIIGLVNTSSDTLGWAGIVSVALALWSARAGVGAMMNGLNEVYGEKNRSSFFHYLRALVLTVALVGVSLVAILAVVVTPIALAFVPLGLIAAWLIEVLRWLVAVAVIFVGVGLLYRYGPNRKRHRMPWLTPGAVLAVLSWAALSIAFSYYVANFGKYNEIYGSIGAVIAMLVWLWISSFLVLLGAVLNFQLEAVHSLWTQDAAEADLPEPAEVVEQVISDGEGPEATEEEEVTVAEAQKPDSPSAA